MKVSIHQPNFMPWCGFFNKISESDVFVILDDVKCSKNSFFNRNKFSSGDNSFWLTIPLSKASYSKNIVDVCASDTRWIDKHIRYFELEHGKTSENKIIETIIERYNDFKLSDIKNICDFNIFLIQDFIEFLNIGVKVIRSSNMNIDKDVKKSDRVIEIVKKAGGTSYISGEGAKSYQDEKDFFDNEIELRYTTFNAHDKMIVNGDIVSAIDYVLREGRCQMMKCLTLR
tara:strand:+ start:4888 stop:5574 length:687 start_codon:yes stop_codon:yes gene_type:complete